MLPCVLFDHINFVMVGGWGGWLVYWSWWVQMLKKSGVKYPCECEHLLHSPSCVRRTIQHWVRLWFFFFYSLRAIVLVATFCFFSNCMKKLSYFLFMFIIRSIEIANTGGNKKPKLYTHKKKNPLLNSIRRLLPKKNGSLLLLLQMQPFTSKVRFSPPLNNKSISCKLKNSFVAHTKI